MTRQQEPESLRLNNTLSQPCYSSSLLPTRLRTDISPHAKKDNNSSHNTDMDTYRYRIEGMYRHRA